MNANASTVLLVVLLLPIPGASRAEDRAASAEQAQRRLRELNVPALRMAIRDLTDTIHPHPTLTETLGAAAEVHLGTATDLFRPKRKA